jgi:hypothetical protein
MVTLLMHTLMAQIAHYVSHIDGSLLFVGFRELKLIGDAKDQARVELNNGKIEIPLSLKAPYRYALLFSIPSYRS